jgi:hypothetical protein
MLLPEEFLLIEVNKPFVLHVIDAEEDFGYLCSSVFSFLAGAMLVDWLYRLVQFVSSSSLCGSPSCVQ